MTDMCKFAVLAAFLALLGACHAVPLALGTSSAVAVATVAAQANTVLSDTSQAACAIQHVANDVGAILPNSSKFADTVSQYAGKLCAW